MFLICHVNSHNHFFKWSCDFMVGCPLTLDHHAANFGGFRPCGSGDKTFFHMISKDHMFKGLCDMLKTPQSKSSLCLN